ncbi:MAG: hypothetical protein LBS06_07545, partial [Treponema sp.]|nr:hypothetical protein [Treponema sp.]
PPPLVKSGTLCGGCGGGGFKGGGGWRGAEGTPEGGDGWDNSLVINCSRKKMRCKHGGQTEKGMDAPGCPPCG